MRCMCGGTDFPQALESLTVVPLRGGDRREDVPFERIAPGGVRIAPIADPSDSEVENRNEWTLDAPLKPCSYVFVDSNQIIGGRIRTAISPRSPGRRNAFRKTPLRSPKCIPVGQASRPV